MNRFGREIAEILRALCVLALVFLNFAHAPPAIAGDTGTAFCGEAPDGSSDPGDARDPCPACRLTDVAVAIVPPCGVEAALRSSLPVDYVLAADAIIFAAGIPAFAARAPPAV